MPVVWPGFEVTRGLTSLDSKEGEWRGEVETVVLGCEAHFTPWPEPTTGPKHLEKVPIYVYIF